MEIVPVLRELWRRRLLVAVAALVAIAAGVLAVYRVGPGGVEARSYRVAVASAAALVDTPASQVAAIGAEGTEFVSLATRANLLANLMAAPPIRLSVASAVRLDPDELIAIPPSQAEAVTATPLAAAAAARLEDARARTMTMRIEPNLPIIAVDAQAPDQRTARAIVDAAFVAVSDELVRLGSAQRLPPDRRLVVTRLGTARSATVVRGPRRLYGPVAAAVVFTLLCAGIVVGGAVAREWRRTADARLVPGALAES